ncbi:MAG TPA: glycoside hydrolase family 36 protein, partial [Vicinamibacterales bacterium]|nr:glycoside hydrolase family 36 protein [Vicinamibacterales bacterium]
QTGGTLGSPVDYSQYTDEKHYRIPAEGRAFYGLMTLTPIKDEARLFAFTSCARFSGRFQLRLPAGDAAETTRHRLQGVLDAEGLELGVGETFPLEELMFVSARAGRSQLLADVASRLNEHHSPLRSPRPPAGWCSWYCFGAQVTAAQVLDNLDVIAKTIPALKYVQIDDGYQPAMGDWLETGAAFGGNVRNVLAQIRTRGFEPAIWVAPFIAEEGSRLFQQHREWFIKDDTGRPLSADRVTFGGWRHGPWYALDATHPEVQQHLELLFRTMRQEWGCTYFKLDANFWGAMHGGRFHDPRATRIEAYRRGMAAVRRGAADAFLLGCNHPIWPSIGEIHGSRSSNDIKRTWDRISTTARQNLSRNWQNGKLWWNDPDAICLSDLTEDELMFHATSIYAAGGLILSGDDLTKLPPARAGALRKLLPPTGVAATFLDDNLDMGEIRLPGRRVLCLFNWGERNQSRVLLLRSGEIAFDFWTGARLNATASPGSGTPQVSFEMPARSARLLEVRNA